MFVCRRLLGYTLVDPYLNLNFLPCFVFCSPAACIDHRGTPVHPARTCTLETDDEAICVRDHFMFIFISPVFSVLVAKMNYHSLLQVILYA